MAVASPFGFASGSGGVNHIGEVLRDGPRLGVALRLTGQPGIVTIEYQRAHPFRQWQGCDQRLLGQQPFDAAVVDHVGQAFRRVFRVQRYIGAAGLQDRQQAHHHFQAAVQCNAHQHIGAYATRDQGMSQSVGPRVELGIGQRLPLEHQRHGMRGPFHLGFDQVVHRLVVRVVGERAVPVLNHHPALHRIEHR